MAWKYRKGFTIVELMVTVVILIILTLLLVTRLVFTQMGGRDQERETDITTIATGLELYYQNGSPDGTIPKGYYPGADQVDAAALLSPPFQDFLEGISKGTYEAPGGPINGNVNFNAPRLVGTNPDGSYTDSDVRGVLMWYPYVYQVLKRDNYPCFTSLDCVKYNLYYIDEQSNTVIKIRSKNQ